MNDILCRIKEICPYIVGIRKGDSGIEVKLSDPKDERAWIHLYQAPIKVEKMVLFWMKIGGSLE